MNLKFDYYELKNGDIVEFTNNVINSKFAVVTGGFGMSLDTIGSKIFGCFGKSKEEAIKHFKQDNKARKELSTIDYLNKWNKPYTGYCRRQKCRIVGKVDLETGEEIVETK